MHKTLNKKLKIFLKQQKKLSLSLKNKECPQCGYFESFSKEVMCDSCKTYSEKRDRWTKDAEVKAQANRVKE